MSQDAFDEGLAALKSDLLRPEGPSITNMSEYRFAVLPYKPNKEFYVRKQVREVSDDLKSKGWQVFELPVNKLLLKRLRNAPQEELDSWIGREKRLVAKGKKERALRTAIDNLEYLIEGQNGIAKDAIEEIHRLADVNQVDTEKTLVWITRMGSLYPFFRTSTLLKHLDGNTRRIPVVVLYPGRRVDKTALSFMEETDADRDYRPRIYP
ncbi:MAG TPA: DUF1788 domain-containing protein [Phycisphaerales bacterium]|nr:DUF1788 domain-containing protein [Phycisphaerales bacterium]